MKYKKQILIACVILLCLAIPPLSVKAYYAYRVWRLNARVAELKRAEEVIKSRYVANATPEQLKIYLVTKYKLFMDKANPSLNEIKINYDEWPLDRTRVQLYAQHPFFSKYSFSVGPFVKHVQQWEIENRAELRRAGVLRIGVRSNMDEMGALIEVQ